MCAAVSSGHSVRPASTRPFASSQGLHRANHRQLQQQQAGYRPATLPRRPVHSRRLACQAAGFSQAAGGGSSKDEAARLPNSREEAVSQAAAAIAAQLSGGGGGGSKGSKGFAGAGSRKLSVDVPVLESGSAATLQLAQDVVAALPKQLRQQFTIVSCAEDVSGSGSGSGSAKVVSLQACVASGKDLTDGCLLIAGPSTAQLDAVMRLLAYWRGAGAVVLNAEWSAESAPVEQVAFIKSFEAVYCFLPLMIKVLFIGQEGAVFKWCTGGSPSSTPWRVFGKEGSRLQPIGRMQQRPSNADLEAIFYNAYAANNPLNRGIKALRGMVGGGGKDGGQ